jgi:hypothetical protein
MCDWPHSLLDWDILFLLPLPWWGPVLAPVSIAALMVIWGTLAAVDPTEARNMPMPWRVWFLNGAGIVLALYVFMTDTLRAAGQGVEAVRNVVPVRFNWLLFCAALVLMASPIIRLIWNWIRRPARPVAQLQPE